MYFHNQRKCLLLPSPEYNVSSQFLTPTLPPELAPCPQALLWLSPLLLLFYTLLCSADKRLEARPRATSGRVYKLLKQEALTKAGMEGTVIAENLCIAGGDMYPKSLVLFMEENSILFMQNVLSISSVKQCRKVRNRNLNALSRMRTNVKKPKDSFTQIHQKVSLPCSKKLGNLTEP